MESKPYTVQSPEQIAKDYAGNKQKIAEAMQMGIVDPTAGTLAGMFIDRMRAAQMQEQAPQGTVAQQVFAPPQPPAPPPAPGGLGATPQAAAMPQMPQQGGPAPMPEIPANPEEEAPAAYAAGGITTLPIPDAMFDEPDNGGYANGGIVAFAEGGGWQNARVTSPYGAKRSYETHPGVDLGLPVGTPIGPLVEGVVVKAASDKVNGKHVIVRHPNGMTTSYLHLDKIAVKPGDTVSSSDLLGLSGNTGRSTGPHLHFGARDEKGNRIDPNILLKNPSILLEGSRNSEGDAEQQDSNSKSKMPQLMELASQFRETLAKNAPPETKRRDELIAELEAGLSPEAIAKERKKDKWAALAQLGFGIAGDAGPGGILGAISRQAKEQLPAYQTEQKQDQALRRADRSALLELENRSNEEKRKIEALAYELAQFQLGELSKERQLELQWKLGQLSAETQRMVSAASNAMQWQVAQLNSRTNLAQTQMTTDATLGAAKIRSQTDPLFGVPNAGAQNSGNVLDFSSLK